MALDVIGMMDQQFDRASAPRPSGKPTFLFFNENGMKARIRPLVNLDRTTVIKMHHKWAQEKEGRVNSVCASEIGKPCKYCDMAPADKKLSPSVSFMLPVYVYQVTDRIGNIVTVKNEQGEDEPIKGIRIIELTAYGVISQVLGILRSYFKEEPHDITACDFVIEQTGEGTNKQLNTIPKAPTAMPDGLKKAVAMVPSERVKQRVVEACPPMVLQSASSASLPSSASSSASVEDDDAPDF